MINGVVFQWMILRTITNSIFRKLSFISMSKEIPFYMDQIIVHKRGSDEPMQVSKHIPPGRNVQFDQSLKYPEGTWNILTLTFKVSKPLKGVVCHRKIGRAHV